MRTVNWYALEEEKLCDICRKRKGRHTTLIGEVLCDECAKILDKYKYITTVEEYTRKTLYRWTMEGKA